MEFCTLANSSFRIEFWRSLVEFVDPSHDVLDQ